MGRRPKYHYTDQAIADATGIPIYRINGIYKVALAKMALEFRRRGMDLIDFEELLDS